MSIVFWLLLITYAVARVLQVFPGPVPIQTVVALHVFPPAIFALVHGAKRYGWRGILTFVAIMLGVACLFESVGVRSGAIYGHYYFTDVMGPKVLQIPVMLAGAYVGMAYLSWMVAQLILGNTTRPSGRTLMQAVTAAFVMVSWDLSMDPVWATILRAWVWIEGGSYFGVPVANFLGWFVTVYVIFQLFALYLKRWPIAKATPPVEYWGEPVLFYAVSAAGNLLLAIPRPGPQLVTDPAGVVWRVSDITHTCALVTIFTMGLCAFVAWVRLKNTDLEKFFG